MIKIDAEHKQEIDYYFRGRIKTVLVPETIKVLNELEDYWPLTLRQVYYRLVAAQIIDNNLNQYQALSRTLTNLRRYDIVPWYVIQDRTRSISPKRGWESAEKFTEHEIDQFLEGYDRCLVQNQENYVEIFVEKDALSTIFEDQAWPYCVRVVTCKGQLSSTFVNSYSERALAAIDKGLEPVILYYGDLDPTGARIPVAIQRNLMKHHSLWVHVRVIALTPQQVKQHNLPHSIEALKENDPNYRWYVRNFGKLAVELDALHPEELKKLIISGLRQVLDFEDMIEQQRIERREREKLKHVKKRLLEILEEENLI